MRYRPLGKSGLLVSVVGLGCNNFGRRLDVEQTRAVVDAAIDVGVTLQHRIDRHHIIGAIDLETVACEIDHGDVGAARLVGEFAQRPAHVERFQIATRHHHLEIRFGEEIGDGGRIVGGIGKLGHVLVGRVADDQRDALAGKSRPIGKTASKCNSKKSGEPAH